MFCLIFTILKSKILHSTAQLLKQQQKLLETYPPWKWGSQIAVGWVRAKHQPPTRTAEHIFQSFEYLPSANTFFTSSGLGSAQCKTLLRVTESCNDFLYGQTAIPHMQCFLSDPIPWSSYCSAQKKVLILVSCWASPSAWNTTPNSRTRWDDDLQSLLLLWHDPLHFQVSFQALSTPREDWGKELL